MSDPITRVAPRFDDQPSGPNVPPPKPPPTPPMPVESG